MNTTRQPVAESIGPREVLRVLATHFKTWSVPAVLFALLAAGYALVRSPDWEAVQALIVRNEAAGVGDGAGRFQRAEDLKTLHSTLQELVRNPTVLAAALKQVGPPANHRHPDLYPAPREIDDFAQTVQLSPPKGAEPGTTEVLYLKVRGTDRQRATLLAAATCDVLIARFQGLRDVRAQSMMVELEQAATLAQGDLDGATTRLATLEQSVGRDLAELRTLNESPNGDSDLRRKSLELENELRQAEVSAQANAELLAVLEASRTDRKTLLATPGRLLESQPALRKLKEGLVDAQLRTAQLLGTMSTAHPLVQAAEAAEAEVATHLHNELETSIRGVQVEQRLASQRIETLQRDLENVKSRLVHVASVRAEYANLAAHVKHRHQLLDDARRKLADARASHAGAESASLISRIDAPQTGARPLGPGRTMIAASGGFGGLLFGLGLVFLSWQPKTAPVVHPVHRTAAAEAATSTDAPQPSGLSLKEAFAGVATSRR